MVKKYIYYIYRKQYFPAEINLTEFQKLKYDKLTVYQM